MKKENATKYIITALGIIAAALLGRLVGYVSASMLNNVTSGTAKDAKDCTEQFLAMMTDGNDDFLNGYKKGIDELVNEYGVDREVADRYGSSLLKVISKIKYTVMDPVETADKEYDVTINYEPILDPTTVGGYADLYAEKISEIDFNLLEESEQYTKMFLILADILEEYRNNLSYGKQKSVTVHYCKQPDGSYGLSEDDGFLIGQEFGTFVQE